MTPLSVILLALIQGVTEFLPISSEAHLILVPRVLGWSDQGLAFDIATHTGTLVAVVVYFRRELGAMTRSLVAPGVEGRRGRRLAAALGMATLPVAVAGPLAQPWVAADGRSLLTIAVASIGFALLLGWADRRGSGERRLEDLRLRHALLIGLAQAVALIPGTSRSGITITAGMFLALDRPSAARFSFLMAVPVGALVALKDLLDLTRGEISLSQFGPMLLGLAVAALSAYVVMGWLLAWLQRRDLRLFVIYRIILGVVLLALWGLRG